MQTECRRYGEVDEEKMKKKGLTKLYNYLNDSSKSCYGYGWYDSTGSNCFLEGSSLGSFFGNHVLPIVIGLGEIALESVTGGIAKIIKIGKRIYDIFNIAYEVMKELLGGMMIPIVASLKSQN